MEKEKAWDITHLMELTQKIKTWDLWIWQPCMFFLFLNSNGIIVSKRKEVLKY